MFIVNTGMYFVQGNQYFFQRIRSEGHTMGKEPSSIEAQKFHVFGIYEKASRTP